MSSSSGRRSWPGCVRCATKKRRGRHMRPRPGHRRETEMASTIWTREPLNVLGKATIVTLIASLIGFTALQLSVGLVLPPVLFVMLGELIVIALIVTGWLWAPVLGAMVGIGTILGGVGVQPYAQYHIEHP